MPNIDELVKHIPVHQPNGTLCSPSIHAPYRGDNKEKSGWKKKDWEKKSLLWTELCLPPSIYILKS